MPTLAPREDARARSRRSSGPTARAAALTVAASLAAIAALAALAPDGHADQLAVQPVWIDAVEEPAPGHSPVWAVLRVDDAKTSEVEAMVGSLDDGVTIVLDAALIAVIRGEDTDDLKIPDRAAVTAHVGASTEAVTLGFFNGSLGRFDVRCRALESHVACRAVSGTTVLAIPLDAVQW